MPKVINYKVLLFKYMALIQNDEGIDYLDRTYEVPVDALKISPEELEVLEFVSKMAHDDLGMG